MTTTIAKKLRAAGCVFAEDEAKLLMAEVSCAAELRKMVDKRVEGLPLEQILGWAEFCGLRIKVAPGVFVPRRRSEFLVFEAIKLTRPGDVVIDVCCGSGALGAALSAALSGVKLYATDSEPAAVACARVNLEPFGGRVFTGDLFNGLPTDLCGKADVILANAPYVPTASLQFMPQEARLHEPKVTLDGGSDGLDIQRRVAAEAKKWLKIGGTLFIETSRSQAPKTVSILAENGYFARSVHNPQTDATVAIGTKPASGY